MNITNKKINKKNNMDFEKLSKEYTELKRLRDGYQKFISDEHEDLAKNISRARHSKEQIQFFIDNPDYKSSNEYFYKERFEHEHKVHKEWIQRNRKWLVRYFKSLKDNEKELEKFKGLQVM
jgi:hypothetical protein